MNLTRGGEKKKFFFFFAIFFSPFRAESCHSSGASCESQGECHICAGQEVTQEVALLGCVPDLAKDTQPAQGEPRVTPSTGVMLPGGRGTVPSLLHLGTSWAGA